jgi:uncharacterized iron-regulated protein
VRATIFGGAAMSVVLAVGAAGCGGSETTPAAAAPVRVAAPERVEFKSPLDREHPLAGKIWDSRTGSFVTEHALADAVVRARLVAIGEQHDNADHHQLEARVLSAMIARGRQPSLVVEMIDDTRQADVDRSLAAHPDDVDALGRAVDFDHSGWPPWRIYRPLFDAAVRAHLRVVAAGVDRPVAMKLARGGVSAVDPDVSRAVDLSQPLPPAQQESRREEMREAHCGLLPDAMLDAMVFVQRVRDAELALRLAQSANDGGVLVAGNGHVRRDRGAPTVLTAAEPPNLVVLGLVEVRPDWTEPERYNAAFGSSNLPFDFVWFTPRASDADHCAEIHAPSK